MFHAFTTTYIPKKTFGTQQLLIVAMLFFFWSHHAFAMFEEATFQKAREAYAAKNEGLLSQYAGELKSHRYILAPYAEYWLLLLRLEKADEIEVLSFLETYNDYPFANRLRGEWLKKLARQENWPLFFEQYTHYQADDVVVQCHNLWGHHQSGDGVDIAQVKNLWLTSAEQPSNCEAVFDAMIQSGTISPENIWERLRLALQDGKPNLAKMIAEKLPNVEMASIKLIDRANQAPQLFLDKPPISFKSRFGAELYLFAIDRLARVNSDNAAASYQKIQSDFEPQNRAFAWNRLAYQAARNLNVNAMTYYSYAKNLAALPAHLQEIPLYKEQYAWQTRAALRESNWQQVLNAITQMSEKQAQEGAWRYWKARALKELAEKSPTPSQEANNLLMQLAKERHYYGWLAAEELEATMSNMPEMPTNSSSEEIEQVANQTKIKRAVALQNLDMRWEAKMEWLSATRNFDDQQLLAAASYAQKLKWYDIAIMTADNTKQNHNFNLRYPTPYRDLFKYAADDEHVDEAWVFGLVRQESRFMDYAKSVVGAAGLMQLMPATAKWAAKRKGIFGYNNNMIHDLRTNIEIGTYYMRHTLDLMGGQAVMATAAYNAGPSRAKRWMADTPLEGAIYIETIPFSETRNYVQKVMANAHLYAPRLGTKIQTLKARIGTVPARSE